MFTHSHCHLNFPELHTQLPAVLQAMQAAQVTRALCIACTMEDFPQVHALALEHPHLWATVGVHPDTEGLHEPSVDELLAAAALPRVVGIGETGLDYYGMQERKGGRSIADLEWQRQRFRTHIRAAQACRKPLVIHTRAAAQAPWPSCAKRAKMAASRSAGGVFHCFTESLATAKAALDLGFFISFSGIVTFKNAQDLRDVAAYVPLDRLLIETDSPYLAPVPYRGKLNSPAYVPYVAQCLAQLRGMAVEDMAALTSRNFDRLFPCVTQGGGA